MANDVKYRLCGGTFFTLMSDARLPLPDKSQTYAGVRSGLTEPELLLALAKVAQPDISVWDYKDEQTIKDNTRQFKSCKSWGGKFFRFKDQSVRHSFDDRVRKEYSKPLSEMISLVHAFLDVNSSSKKDVYLVKALIELIDADDSIEPAHEFFVCKDGSAMTKAALLSRHEFTLESFLLGIWHFTLTDVVDNRIGEATYNNWCPAKGGAQRDYTKAIGEHSSREIKLNYCRDMRNAHETGDQTDGAESCEAEIGCDTPQASDAESYDAEIIEEASSQGQTVQQTVNLPFVFNFSQSGNNNTQIGHVENYYAGRKGDKDDG